jgi:cell division protein FtsL
MDLQQTFYVMAIVYMAIMFGIMVAIVAALFALKAKIDAIHRNIESKINAVTNIAEVGEELFNKAKKAVGRR